MDDSQKRKIISESSRSIREMIFPFSISMIDIDARPRKLSSGTIIQIEDRILIATCSHNIPQNPEGRLWILPPDARNAYDGMLGFTSIRRHPILDLGFLEVDPTSLREYLPSKTCCVLDRLQNNGCGRSNRQISIFGSPVQFIEGDGTELDPQKAKMMSFSTVPFEPSGFPTVPESNRPADQNIDIFYNYPEIGIRLAADDEIDLTNPEGFSGGGIWDEGFTTDEIWRLSSVKLIGIQSSWYEPERYARGIQIKHWLELVWNEMPDLRQAIESSFPSENFVIFES